MSAFIHLHERRKTHPEDFNGDVLSSCDACSIHGRNYRDALRHRCRCREQRAEDQRVGMFHLFDGRGGLKWTLEFQKAVEHILYASH